MGRVIIKDRLVVGIEDVRLNNGLHVAILYICTGKYSVFWEDFYRSMERYFLRQSKVEYFVFTDADKLYDEERNLRIHRIRQENLGWPGNTLFRFHMFVSISERLEDYDYLFFLNANTVCRQEIMEEEFLPTEQDLLVVQHPGYYNCSVWKMPYERRKISSASIPWGKGRDYVYGAVNGGKRVAFLDMAKELDDEIRRDYEKDIIAKLHDESHLNHYVWKYGNYKLLTPAYAYPENYQLPFERKIMTIDKGTKIELDQNKLQELKDRSVKGRMLKMIRRA